MVHFMLTDKISSQSASFEQEHSGTVKRKTMEKNNLSPTYSINCLAVSQIPGGPLLTTSRTTKGPRTPG